MLGIKRIDIADNERGLLFIKNSFKRVLEPGRYWFLNPLANARVEKHDITVPEFQHRLGKFLVATYPELADRYLDAYELTDNQMGLCYVDGKLTDVISPASFKAYWKSPAKIDVELIDIAESYDVPGDVLALLSHKENFKAKQATLHCIYYVEIPDNFVGLLTINGKQEKLLAPGSYGYWRFNRNVAVKYIDCRLQTIEVTGQEILTKDRVSLRINLSGNYCLVDPEKAATLVADYAQFLYREMQLELRKAVGIRTLDSLLEDKDSLNQTGAEGIVGRAQEYGLKVESVGVKDIILPGEMKAILNQVVEAEKAAEANLIKRREETAATRSLHNTAKVMAGNPTLLRLKELETLEKVSDRIDKITVYGGLDGVLRDLVKIPLSVDA